MHGVKYDPSDGESGRGEGGGRGEGRGGCQGEKGRGSTLTRPKGQSVHFARSVLMQR